MDGRLYAILFVVLIFGIIGLGLAVSSFFRYRETRDKKDYRTIVVGSLLLAPCLKLGLLFGSSCVGEAIGSVDKSWVEKRAGLLLIIAAAIGLGLFLFSLLRRIRSHSQKGGVGMAIGLLILIWIAIAGMPVCIAYDYPII